EVREVAGTRQRLPDRRGAPRRRDGEAAVPPAPRRRRRRRARPRPGGRAGVRGAAADLQPRRQRGRAQRQRRARGAHVPAPPRVGAGQPVLDPDRRRRDPRDRPRRHDLPRRHGPREGPGGGRGRRLRLPAPGGRQPAGRDPPRNRRGGRGARPPDRRPADRVRPAVPQPHERLVLDRARARPHPRAHLRARRRRDDVERHGRHRSRAGARAARRRLAGDGRAGRRGARRRRRGGPPRRPDRLGRPGVHGHLARERTRRRAI
ncbi:MAG: Diaminopimelate epimerase, partial [uncultured Solirubrobacteraceae bacterium]